MLFRYSESQWHALAAIGLGTRCHPCRSTPTTLRPNCSARAAGHDATADAAARGAQARPGCVLDAGEGGGVVTAARCAGRRIRKRRSTAGVRWHRARLRVQGSRAPARCADAAQQMGTEAAMRRAR